MHLFILLYNFLLKYSSFTMCKCTSKWFSCTYIYKGFPGGTVAKKKSTCQCRRYQRLGFVPWVRKIPWRRRWQPSPVFLPGEFHGQKILAGYSPWGRKELNIAEHTHTHIYTYTYILFQILSIMGYDKVLSIVPILCSGFLLLTYFTYSRVCLFAPMPHSGYYKCFLSVSLFLFCK